MMSRGNSGKGAIMAAYDFEEAFADIVLAAIDEAAADEAAIFADYGDEEA